jgi:acetyl-CoA C-acetyltransferase
MGVFAEATADKYGFTREQQDEFAITSLKRAQAAIESGAFADEITPVVIKTRKGEVTVDTDEQPFNANIDKIPSLRPAFRQDGTVTAANSSSISDGGVNGRGRGRKTRYQAAGGDPRACHPRA